MDKEEFLSQHRKSIAQRKINDWRRVLNLPEGRRVIYSLLMDCSHRTNAFVPGDPYATAYNCAKRAFGCYMEEMVRTANPSAYEQMEQEFKAEVRQFQKALENMEEL